MAKKSADQTGANFTSGSILAWDGEVYDVGGWHDNVTNNSRLTVPSGVNYVEVSASVRYLNNTPDTWMSLTLLKNGSATFDGACQQGFEIGGAGASISIHSGVISVVAGDYFEVSMQVETDTSVDIAAARSNFSIRAVG
jgi:hypothetical protein